jgi:hypothetical protein
MHLLTSYVYAVEIMYISKVVKIIGAMAGISTISVKPLLAINA